jgi:hypothetical protein
VAHLPLAHTHVPAVGERRLAHRCMCLTFAHRTFASTPRARTSQRNCVTAAGGTPLASPFQAGSYWRGGQACNASARLVLEVSAGWASSSSRGLCCGHALLLSTGAAGTWNPETFMRPCLPHSIGAPAGSSDGSCLNAPVDTWSPSVCTTYTHPPLSPPSVCAWVQGERQRSGAVVTISLDAARSASGCVAIRSWGNAYTMGPCSCTSPLLTTVASTPIPAGVFVNAITLLRRCMWFEPKP